MESLGIDIRPAGPDDLPAVRDLLVVTWHDTYDLLIGSDKVTEITDAWHSIEALAPQLEIPRTSFLVAEHGKIIVGHLFANAQHPPVLFLRRLYVLPHSQRRGIGAKLLSRAIERHPDGNVVRLDVEADNVAGRSFYRRQGFQDVSRITEHGIEHIRMEKRLAPSA